LGSVKEKSYMELAEVAFQKGDTNKAQQLFFAHFLAAEDSDLSKMASHFKLYRPETKPENLTPTSDFGTAVKPRLATELKFAVGMILELGNQVTDVKPVGTRQIQGGGGMGPGGEDGGMGLGGMSGMGGSAGNQANSKLEAFEDLTGDYGKSILAAFESRRTGGRFGSLFSDLSLKSSANHPASGFTGGEDGSGGPGYGPGYGAGYGGPDAGFGGPGAGIGGPGAGFGPGDGSDDSGPGMGGPGMGGFGPGMGAGGMGPAGARPSKTMPGKALTSGLVYIGKAGSGMELLKKAVAAGYDGLFIFEIKATINRGNRIVTNDTMVRFMLPSGKVVASASKAVKNTDVELAAIRGKDSDEVQKQTDILFNKLDAVVKVADVPNMPAATALKQLQLKLHSEVPDKLQILAEAKMFQVKGIISQEQLQMVNQIVLEGNEGIVLAKGSAEDRKLVMTPLIEHL
jgi:hypothetical protein